MSDNISLSIGPNSKGLSFEIDKLLDAELNVDVKLNLAEWNSVFNLIKQNQVETNKNQFTDIVMLMWIKKTLSWLHRKRNIKKIVLRL